LKNQETGESIMSISKRQATQLLEKKIAEFEDVIKYATYENSYNHKYEHVYHGAKSLIEELFGDKEGKKFVMNTNASVIVINGDEDHQKALNNYKEHIKTCIAHLSIYMERIERSWDTKDQNNKRALKTKPNLIKKWIKANLNVILITTICSIFSGVSTGLIVYYLTKPPNDSFKQIEVDFSNWLEEYDSKIMNGYNDIENDFASRGLYDSGIRIKAGVDYFRECRRLRDNKIDSFVIAYHLAGGDTLQLKYRRKLPVNVHNVIKPGQTGARLKNDRYRLDTL